MLEDDEKEMEGFGLVAGVEGEEKEGKRWWIEEWVAVALVRQLEAFESSSRPPMSGRAGISIQYHFKSRLRGVIQDSRDLYPS